LIIPQIPLLRHGQFADSFQMDSAAEIKECMEKRIKKSLSSTTTCGDVVEIAM